MTAVEDQACVSGTLVDGLIVVARETLGAPVVERGFAAAPADAADAVLGALPGVWVPIALAEQAFSSVAHEAGRDWALLHSELARLSVERAVKTFWRVLLRFTSDEALMSRTPVIFHKSYNRGRLVPEFTGQARAEAQLLDWPDVPDWPLRGTKSGIEVVLRLAGRKGVRVECHRTPAGATFVATWR
jgi:hypothetical protein